VVLLCFGVNRLTVRLNSSQMRKSATVSLIPLVSFLLFLIFYLQNMCCFAQSWESEVEDFADLGTTFPQEILPSLRTLMTEAEQILDSPRQRSHQGKSPWSSMG